MVGIRNVSLTSYVPVVVKLPHENMNKILQKIENRVFSKHYISFHRGARGVSV